MVAPQECHERQNASVATEIEHDGRRLLRRGLCDAFEIVGSDANNTQTRVDKKLFD
jgi:hypothetical protein